jgi:type VI secretion system protein ImpJ
MKPLSRVVWNEGMHLAQHHFQAQNRYFEDSVTFALSHLFFRPYGVAGIELDADALRNGTVAVIHARGVMPDGLAFNFPEDDPAPASREIRDLFSPTHDSHLVHLAIPPYRYGQANCVINGGGDAPDDVRYIAETDTVPDEITGSDEKPVQVGRKNFRIALDIELREERVSMPLGRVKRDGTGHFIYDPEYVPPCLQVGASRRIIEVLHRLIDILNAKSEALAGERSEARGGIGEYAARDVASFWLSHAIHSNLGPLRHHLEVKRTRPDELYSDLVRLAGALCTFSFESHPRDLPPYDHDDLETCLTALDRHIRSHLDVLMPTNVIAVSLKRERQYLHVGKMTDKRAFGRSQWILGVRSSAGDAQVIAGVPKLAKMCAEKYIVRLVKEAYAGMTLTHLPSPPSAISPRAGTHYFAVDKTGPCWEAITQSGELGVYVPDALPEADIDLSVVLDT